MKIAERVEKTIEVSFSIEEALSLRRVLGRLTVFALRELGVSEADIAADIPYILYALLDNKVYGTFDKPQIF